MVKFNSYLVLVSLTLAMVLAIAIYETVTGPVTWATLLWWVAVTLAAVSWVIQLRRVVGEEEER